ncbi:cruciform cutting endonuclease 1, partial [Lecanoromycetidae sp. Uapishka_2]
MAPTLSWLNACKNSQLKALATAVGVNSSGTKPVLTSALLEHLPHSPFDKDGRRGSGTQEGHHIISIDMGIRNLAYCRLVIPHENPAGKLRTGQFEPFGLPIIYEWTRLAISSKRKTIELPEENQVKEAFDPATYSQYAYDLVTTLLKDTSRTRPTHILIERQRFRSMGGSSVQEWTLRVNVFEAMLYAVLKTFSKELGWKGAVHPIMPAKVSKFWLGDAQGASAEGMGSKSAKTKTAKINLVAGWLQKSDRERERFYVEAQAAELARAYLRKTSGGKLVLAKQEKNESLHRIIAVPDAIGKLDDLADCLLQGMAWIQWEKNRQLITSKGLRALDELDA